MSQSETASAPHCTNRNCQVRMRALVKRLHDSHREEVDLSIELECLKSQISTVRGTSRDSVTPLANLDLQASSMNVCSSCSNGLNDAKQEKEILSRELDIARNEIATSRVVAEKNGQIAASLRQDNDRLTEQLGQVNDDKAQVSQYKEENAILINKVKVAKDKYDALVRAFDRLHAQYEVLRQLLTPDQVKQAAKAMPPKLDSCSDDEEGEDEEGDEED